MKTYKAKFKQVEKLTKVNKDKKNLKKYVVMLTAGYPSDRFHSPCDTSPEFDSSFNSKEKANLRAEYKFYFKNYWGLGIEELIEGSEIVKSENGGLKTFKVFGGDGEIVTVGAVDKGVYTYQTQSVNETQEFRDGFW